jgi:hypothetical protein
MITRLSRSLGGPVIWIGTTVALPGSCAFAVWAPSADAKATVARTASLSRITPLFRFSGHRKMHDAAQRSLRLSMKISMSTSSYEQVWAAHRWDMPAR